MTRPTHALSVDVEDWYNGLVLVCDDRVVPPTPAVVRNTEALLALFAERGVRATWFLLGEVAAAFPGLVARIAAGGHELGVHGFHHFRIQRFNPATFREAIRRAKETVEQAGGCAVLGHRAVAFSVTARTPWVYEVLAELGFRYDSSVFPFAGRRYGMAGAPLVPYQISTGHGAIQEVPLTVVRFGPIRLPCAGGGYLRHFPYWWTRLGLRRCEGEGRAGVIYLHPYEVDLAYDEAFVRRELPHVAPRRLAQIRRSQYRHRERTVPKLRRLMAEFSFAPVASLLGLPVSTAASIVA